MMGGWPSLPAAFRDSHNRTRVPLDKSEGSVKDKDILSVFFAPFALPERFEDQDSGNLTLNHFSAELVVPPTIDTA